MFYDIHKRERSHKTNRTNYIDLAKQFMFTLPYPIVFFVDETDNEEIIACIQKERDKAGYKEQTYIYKIDVENTHYYKYIDRLTELQKTFRIFNGHIEHETPHYITITNDKFFFVEKTIELNPFQSTHFIWIDFGINHVARDCHRIHDWITDIPDQIKQMCINPYVEDRLKGDDPIHDRRIFTNIYHHTAAGVFSGNAEHMLRYSRLFLSKTEQIYAENWYQLEEAVMTIVQRENPDLFVNYYGDYKGIISNYKTPMHNFDIVFAAVQKCISHGEHARAQHILDFCEPFFETDFFHQQVILFFYYSFTNVQQAQQAQKVKPSILDMIRKILDREKVAGNNAGIVSMIQQTKNLSTFYEGSFGF